MQILQVTDMIFYWSDYSKLGIINSSSKENLLIENIDVDREQQLFSHFSALSFISNVGASYVTLSHFYKKNCMTNDLVTNMNWIPYFFTWKHTTID